MPGTFMAISWNQDGHTSIVKNTTISYLNKSNYLEKSQIDQQDNIGEVTKISPEKTTTNS